MSDGQGAKDNSQFYINYMKSNFYLNFQNLVEIKVGLP